MVLRRRLTLGATAAVAVTLLAWNPPAQAAKKKVAVHAFSGPGGSRVRGAFVGAIKRSAKVVSAKACSAGACHATVKGSVSKRGRRFRVVVTVYSGADDDVIGRRSAGARSRRQLGRVGASLARACVKLIAKGRTGGGAAVAAREPAADPTPAPTPTPPPTPTPAEPQPAAQQPVEDELFTTKQRRADAEKEADGDKDGDRPRARDGEDEDEDGGRVRRRRKSKWSGLLDISAALGLATRSYELAGANASDNSTYEGGMYPEFTVRLDLYPTVLFTKGFLRNLGLGVAYSRHISISTKLPTANAEVETGSQELLIDARLRWPLFDRPTTPVISVLAGFGLRDFDLAKSAVDGDGNEQPNLVLTSFNYKFMRFGVEGIVPLGSPLVSLFAGFDARPLLGVGQDAVEAYGVRSGGFGWAVRGGAYGKAAFGMFYFLAFEYLAFSSSFDGRSDAQPNTIERSEPTEGSDRFIRLWAGVGYAL